jgi:uncharacterized protein YggT (Ycf19 family)
MNLKLTQNQRGSSVIGGIISFVFGVIVTVLALRFVFRLLGADASNGFVNWVYQFSEPFVRPFVGIFHTDLNLTVGSFETATLVALLVYGLIAGLVLRLFNDR